MAGGEKKGFMGNPNVKEAGVQVSFTEEQVKEWVKCSKDPSYFINHYVKIVSLDKGIIPFKLHPYQERIVETVNNNRFTITMLFRQSGKSTITAAYVLWYVMFNEHKNVIMLANKMATAKEIFGRVRGMYELLPDWIKPGVTAWNVTSFTLENGSTASCAATSPSAVRGRSCVAGDTKVCVACNNDVYYVNIDTLTNANFPIMSTESVDVKYYVYKITNTLNGKIYVGYHHTTNFDDGYMGSGKAIMRAIKKYGVENFKKEMLYKFDTQQEAEAKEREIVNEEFVARNDTYNMTIGGNVCVLRGENNGFYGKHHSPETLEKMRQTRLANGGFVNKNKERFIVDGNLVEGYSAVAATLNIQHNSRNQIIHMCGNPEINVRYESDEKQKRAEELYKEYVQSLKNKHDLLSQLAKERNTGRVYSAERNKKLSESLKGRKCPHNQITNRNPEKIRKTAEKHRGMKRSAEAKLKMSMAKRGKDTFTKGKLMAYDPTGKRVYLSKDTILAEGWQWSTNALRTMSKS